MKKERLFLIHKNGAILKPITVFFLSSVTIFFMPLFSRETNALMANILALIFWLLLIAGVVFTVLLSKNCELQKSKSKVFPQIFCFFIPNQTRIIDTVLIISILSTIIMAILNRNIACLQTLFIFLSIFSMELHCVLSLTKIK